MEISEYAEEDKARKGSSSGHVIVENLGKNHYI